MPRPTGTQHVAAAPPPPGDDPESLDLGRAVVLPEPTSSSDAPVPSAAPPPASDSRVHPPALPPPPTAPARAPERKDRHIIRANPRVQLAQAKRFATGVLEYYNKRRKIKFELLDAEPAISIPEPRCCYTHFNFTARPSREGSREQLFFAEIYHCTKRRAPCGFIVTCCEPLGPCSTGGHKFLKSDGASAVRKNADFSYCFACTKDILHPKGENYVAGHCNIPSVYDYVR